MSKIQVDEIYDLDGTGAPLLPKGAVVTGVLTATSYDGDGSNLQNITLPEDININTTGIVTAASFTGDGSNLSNVNLGSSSSVNTTGVITATSFSGDGSNLTNVTLGSSASVNTTGTITAALFTGNGSGLVFAPKVIAFNPAALSTGAAIGTNITITFDQNIYFSGSGTIQIRQGSASGTIVESFAITSGTPASGLSISGTQLIINPTSSLPQGSNIYLVLPSAGIANAEGIYYAGSNNYNFQTEAAAFTAQGGDIQLNLIDPTSPTGYYKYHIFTTAGILTTTQSTTVADSFSFMMIGGGGGGGMGGPYPTATIGGGGGAGGYITETGPTLGLVANQYTVTIGAGGNGRSPTVPGGFPGPAAGTETTLVSPTYTLIAYGGGFGGAHPSPYGGSVGGSGGGGGGFYPNGPYPGSSGVVGQGNPGGTARPNQPVPSSYYDIGGGGGGGAGQAGGSTQIYPGPAVPTQYVRGGQGGDGVRNPAFVATTLQPHIPPATIPPNTWIASGPTNDYWAGGGAGGYGSPSYGTVNRGGYGGGGNPGPPSLPTNVFPDSPVRPTVPILPTYNPNIPPNGGQSAGGGGGGTYSSSGSGNGGSGVLMIRYAAPASA